MARTKRKPKGSPERAIAYLRVSKEEQSLSPEAQAAAIEQWSKANGVETVACFLENGISGGDAIEKRPGLLEAIGSLAELDAGVLVISKRDRLARDAMYAAMVEQLAKREGAIVASADGVGNGDGPEARMMRGIVDLFAEYERLLIAARTKAALDIKRRRGERIGLHAAFGTRLSSDGKRVEVDKRELRTMAFIRKLHAQGLSLHKIVARLDHMPKSHPARGRKWYAMGVSRILKEVQ